MLVDLVVFGNRFFKSGVAYGADTLAADTADVFNIAVFGDGNDNVTLHKDLTDRIFCGINALGSKAKGAVNVAGRELSGNFRALDGDYLHIPADVRADGICYIDGKALDIFAVHISEGGRIGVDTDYEHTLGWDLNLAQSGGVALKFDIVGAQPFGRKAAEAAVCSQTAQAGLHKVGNKVIAAIDAGILLCADLFQNGVGAHLVLSAARQTETKGGHEYESQYSFHVRTSIINLLARLRKACQ